MMGTRDIFIKNFKSRKIMKNQVSGGQGLANGC